MPAAVDVVGMRHTEAAIESGVGFTGDQRRLTTCKRAEIVKIFTTVIVILLAGATSATAERGPVLNCARYHAGTPVGDGEYTDGALLEAHGIGCRSALALVKPRYRWVIRRESRSCDSCTPNSAQSASASFAVITRPTARSLFKACMAQGGLVHVHLIGRLATHSGSSVQSTRPTAAHAQVALDGQSSVMTGEARGASSRSFCF